MSERQKQALEAIIEQVNPARRSFLQRLLLGGAAAAFVAPVSALLAQSGSGDGKGKGGGKGKGDGTGKGKGDGTGKGKGDGTGKGKGDGTGKGKGKGKGKGTGGSGT